jgi:hypothetical protein
VGIVNVALGADGHVDDLPVQGEGESAVSVCAQGVDVKAADNVLPPVPP